MAINVLMASRGQRVHVATTTRKYKDKVYTTHLLRRSYREDGQVKNETVGNLSHLPDEVIELIRRALKGEAMGAVEESFEVIASASHGHVKAVEVAMRKLGIAALLSSKPCAESRLVQAMIAARIVAPNTKLATTRLWHTSTLAEEFGVDGASEDELYEAMDWLLERQPAIEKKLAARHVSSGSLVLYDLTSSYFEGRTCPLAKLGYSRDGKKDKLQVNYGLLTDARGCPFAVSVYEGNVADTRTLMDQVVRLRDDFGIERIVLVGDRGMISQKRIEELRALGGVDWISALRSGQIRSLMNDGKIQLGLFDERNLFELTHPDFPGERLIACRNPELAKLRAHKRADLLAATAAELERVKSMVERGRLRGRDKIGVRVGRVINKYKVAKHFDLEIEDDSFAYRVRDQEVAAEAALDGIYVVRSSLSKKQMNGPDTVRAYKGLSAVERAFRSIKTVDLKVRPIHHRLEQRVRAHIFLCMLAYYVEWHMREAWRSLLFSDENLEAKRTRDPVAPARRSESAEEKADTKLLPDGSPVHSFGTLLAELSTIVRNTCRSASAPDNTFSLVTTTTAEQQRALSLLDKIKV